MSDERENLNPTEQALASFAPTAPQPDRHRLMSLAGQASAIDPVARNAASSPSRLAAHWMWAASTATLAATSLALAVALVARPAPQPPLVVRTVPAAGQSAEGPQIVTA